MLQISFVISSYRKKLAEKCVQSIENSVDCPVEFVVIENKGGRKSIFQVYDEGADKARYPILCFLHEDVEILSNKYWLDNVEKLFGKNDTGVVGVAGSKDLTESGIWWDRGNRLSGAAMHVQPDTSMTSIGLHEGQEYMTSFGGPYGRVVVVDGVIFLIKKKIYLKLGGYKDTQLDGFHFYDVDLCMRAHWAGYRNYTTDLLVRHLSIGEMPRQWEINRQRWLSQYIDRLPVNVD